MKITIFYSSIHKTRGNTYVIIDAFAQGARAANATVDIVFLAEKEIQPCMACLKCWTKTPGKCVIPDDMASLLNQFMESDIVVMATPVYIHNVTGIMKTFLDRMMPIIDPHLVKMENGYTGHVKKHQTYPKFGLIATGAFPEQKCCEFVSQYFNRLALELYSDVVFEICRGQAILLKMGEKTPLGPMVDEYKKDVRKAGREVVENLKISEAIANRLDQLFVPEEMYIEQANHYWDSRISHYEK
ncbi:MAG: flavodoxin family protein [Deltaproteobacteria bacterium]|nr:flavodoxin family protein [Deltaproteobacteria bacterium]NNK84965.1 flavodoxin family protein [Desulfobacterales bacterium]